MSSACFVLMKKKPCRLTKMWGMMSECHCTQLQAISQAKNLLSNISGGGLTGAHMTAIRQLELELLEWIINFSGWVSAQRSFVKALNGWLVKGLNYVPEVTEDGVPPFSPGRLGAPPIFVISNYWSQIMDMISEIEAVEAMQVCASIVFNLWEQHNSAQRQDSIANRDADRARRKMDKERQFVHKEIEAQNRKMLHILGRSGAALAEPVAGPGVEVRSLQSSVSRIFEAMESFTAISKKAYEELHARAEEEKEKLARENAIGPSSSSRT